MNILGFGAADVDRIDSGGGQIREHTVEIGDTVLAVDNIGSMTIITGRKSFMPALIGAGVALFGLALLSTSSKFLGGMVVVAGAGFAVWWLLQKVDVFLSIGTCDGRRTHIVSKNARFLSEVRDFLREKIDKRSSAGGTINIGGATFTGGIAFGTGARATGQGGDMHNSDGGLK